MVSKDLVKAVAWYLPVIIWLVLGFVILSVVGCGDQKSDTEVTGPEDKVTEPEDDLPLDLPPDAESGWIDYNDPAWGKEYFLREDFTQNKFRITYSSETHNTMTMDGDQATKPIKEESIEAVMTLTPTGTDQQGQKMLLLETEQIVLETNNVRIDSLEPLTPEEFEQNRRLFDIHKALQTLAAEKITLLVDEKNVITDVTESDLINKISEESNTFKNFINSFGQTFKEKIVKSVFMAAADYLPQERIKIGSSWNILIPGDGGELGQIELWVQGLLDEIYTAEGREQARISFIVQQASADEKPTEINGQTVKITQMSHNGTGSMVFDIAENFAAEYSIHLLGSIDIILPDEAKSKFSLDEEVRITKEIINDDK
ncbi:hypothetical protein ACFL02_08830 [Planctomycetota bacterium]